MNADMKPYPKAKPNLACPTCEGKGTRKTIALSPRTLFHDVPCERCGGTGRTKPTTSGYVPSLTKSAASPSSSSDHPTH